MTGTRNDLAAALLARLNTPLQALTAPVTAYEWDAAPQTGGEYVLVTLSRAFGGNLRGDVKAPSYWRATTRAVGDLTNVGIYLDVCTTALEHESVTVGGLESTGIQFEAEDDVRQDDADQSLWSGLRSWTFAF